MRHKVIALLTAAAIIVLAWYLTGRNSTGSSGQSTGQNTPIVGKVYLTTDQKAENRPAIPEFVAQPTSGSPYNINSVSGKYIFINFWNTWCPPCQEEMPDLARLYRDYRDKNVAFYFINITAGEKSPAEVEKFLQQQGLKLPVYLDETGEVATAFGVRAIPTTVVVNPSGQLVYARAGALTYEKARALIR
ncbi:TlpA family protein disulfide reductase [Desulfurispora thermophila]|uniref:TlpA family protein disulfide reductase n=1 Tax=Desulfurispora thermophila TaxID=265470 RepID=UPI00037C07A1|nr:TlpA disulfide reductase family protein [Desulfurispora thermophila]